MAIHFVKRQCQLAAKLETTAGTAISLSASDATVRVMDDVNVSLNFETVKQDLLTADLSELPDLIGNRPVQLQFSTLLKGAGTSATTVAAWTKFFTSGGFSETVGGSSVVYAPNNAPGDVKPLTMAVWYGPTSSTAGKLYTIKGCRPQTLSMQFDSGQKAVLSCTFLGAFESATEASAYSSPTYPSTVPQTVRNLGMTIGSWTPFFRTFNITVTNQLAMIANPGASSEASGISHYEITGRMVTGSIEFLEVLESVQDIESVLTAGTEQALTFTLGASSANKVKIDAPKLQFLTMPEANIDGLLGRNLGFKCNRSSGNDELTVTTL